MCVQMAILLQVPPLSWAEAGRHCQLIATPTLQLSVSHTRLPADLLCLQGALSTRCSAFGVVFAKSLVFVCVCLCVCFLVTAMKAGSPSDNVYDVLLLCWLITALLLENNQCFWHLKLDICSGQLFLCHNAIQQQVNLSAATKLRGG